MIDMAMRLAPEDLPDPPWALHVTPPSGSGATYDRGGPCVWVQDNERWLRAVRIDIEQGPRGARAIHGALQRDLRALLRILTG